ncbi:C-type lectin domain 4 member M [Biomphalaria glabrata]|uniref:Uncharacterized protein LOC106051628 n=1 Tax=Biomphalaria glabrata TaxID=6526 RepID=A0A9U8DUQ7_BIOGL|nr:uncharacterized protein LOC106051628 [Biomphalaria glabrata]KAI8744298.1 CD209 antigen-like protein 2 [Biomphalaria glabrata]
MVFSNRTGLKLFFLVYITHYADCVLTREHLFLLNNDMYLTIVKVGVELSDTNVSYCIYQCQALNGACNSILFNTDNRQCSLGSKIASTATARDTSTFMLYHGRACNESAGFNTVTDGTTTACIWISSSSLRADLAYKDCQYKKSHLFAPRSLDKFNLLGHVMLSYNDDVFVGLDDSEEEGVFRLADDGSKLNPDLIPLMFTKGQPDNYFNEDFVFYYSASRRLNDVKADIISRYVCEIYIFI